MQWKTKQAALMVEWWNLQIPYQTVNYLPIKESQQHMSTSQWKGENIKKRIVLAWNSTVENVKQILRSLISMKKIGKICNFLELFFAPSRSFCWRLTCNTIPESGHVTIIHFLGKDNILLHVNSLDILEIAWFQLDFLSSLNVT